MDFHGATMKGPFKVDIETSKPAWAVGDEGRLIYVDDEDKFYYGTAAEWVTISSFKSFIVDGQSTIIANAVDSSIRLAYEGDITITTNNTTNTITFTLASKILSAIDTESGAINIAANKITILGGEAMAVTHSGTTITISADVATTTARGVASFDTNDFTVTAGAVSIKDTGVIHDSLTGHGTNTHEDIDDHIAANSNVHGLGTGSVVVGTTNSQILTDKTLITPSIDSFVNATHDHGNAANGGNTLNTPAIDNFSNATHNHTSPATGGVLAAPSITSFANATHDHGNAANGGNTLNTPAIDNFSNATHNHSDAITGGDTLVNTTLTTPHINNFANAQHTHNSASQGGPISIPPVGTIYWYSMSNVPINHLVCNGASLLRSSYPLLFAVLGTFYGSTGDEYFSIPDLRGLFIRGWDAGRGLDTNRQFAIYQPDQFKAHTHQIKEGHEKPWGDDRSGHGNTEYLTSGDDYTKTIAWFSTTTTDGGSESRPRNLSLLPIIKYQ